MKTIKIKISLTEQQEEKFNQFTKELKWLWNVILSTQLYNHCLNWYDWAEKVNKNLLKVQANNIDLLPFDLDGIIKCPLQFGRTAFFGASCQIAYGGNYWKKDESVKIPYKNGKGETVLKHGYKLVMGDKPYTKVPVVPHIYRTVEVRGQIKELTDPDSYDRMERLNTLRALQNLPPLIISSDYVGGLIKQTFATAWNAYLDPKQVNRKKLLFKGIDDDIKTLVNIQNPPKIDFVNNLITVQGLGKLKVIDKNYKARLSYKGYVPRSYTITSNSSGYYICITIAHPKTGEKSILVKKLSQAKKQYGVESQEYLQLKKQQADLLTEIATAEFKKQKGISVGVDPGVSAVVATDDGALFVPNITRDRIEVHIEKLQNKLSKVKELNDQKWNQSGAKGARPKSKNEIKLQSKITRLHERAANGTNAFNNKLSTRLARTYTVICWEDSRIQNMIKRCAPKLSNEHEGYDHNGASAKSGLNRILRIRSLGGLRAKCEYKVKLYGGEFRTPKPHNSSQECSCCGFKGQRLNQSTFVCTNENCSEFNIIKNADSNAAKNHKRNAGIEVGQATKYSTLKLNYSRAKRYKDTFKASEDLLQ